MRVQAVLAVGFTRSHEANAAFARVCATCTARLRVCRGEPEQCSVPPASSLVSLGIVWEVHYPRGSPHVWFPACLALQGPADGKCLLLLIIHRWTECTEESVRACVCLPVTPFIFVTVCIRKLLHTAVSPRWETSAPLNDASLLRCLILGVILSSFVRLIFSCNVFKQYDWTYDDLFAERQRAASHKDPQMQVWWQRKFYAWSYRGKKLGRLIFAGSSLNMDSRLFHISAEARSSFIH